MANLKFFKAAYSENGPANAAVGAVWFDTTNRLIKVKLADGAWQAYSGLQNAEWLEATKQLQLTKADGTKFTVDLSDVASATALNTLIGRVNTAEGEIAKKLNTADQVVKSVDTTADAGVALVHGADGTLSVSVAEGAVAENNEAVVVGGQVYAAVEAAKTELAGQISGKNVDAQGDDYVSASAANNKVTVDATTKLSEAVAKAETAVQEVVTGATNGTIKVDGTEVAVAGLKDAAYVTVESLNATAKGYADAAESAAEGRVDGKLANKADKATYEAYVEANNERVAAAEKAIADETDRAEAAEALLNEKIGVPSDVESVSAYSKDYTVGMDVKAAKDAAAEAQRTIDEFLTGEGIAPETLNSLKEITDYIETHGGEYTALVENLGDLSDAIDVLNGNAETAGSVAKAVADAKAEINATIEANEKVTAEALTELDGRVDALEGMGLAGVIEGFEGRIAANEAAVTTVDSRIATAKGEAVDAAAADATSKANTAESNAKGYADGLIAAEVTRSDKYADDAVAAEALIARAAEKANADAITALDAALKAGEGFAWVTFE